MNSVCKYFVKVNMIHIEISVPDECSDLPFCRRLKIVKRHQINHDCDKRAHVMD